MSAQHTPGSWHWYDRFGRKNGVGPTMPGKNMLGEDPPVGQCSHNSFVVADEQGFVVARCSNALVTMESERSEANARLIASAPAVADVLRQFLSNVDAGSLVVGSEDRRETLRDIEVARALLATIDGKAVE